MRASVVLILLSTLQGIADAQAAPALQLESHPLAGRVFDLRTGLEIGPDGLRRRAIASRFVLLGETHDNPRHHELQARVLTGITESGRRPLVAWEMIDASRAEALAECVADCDDWPRELPQRLDWAASGWPAWSLYEPIAAVAARNRLGMVAANLAPDELRQLIGPPSTERSTLTTVLGIDATLPDAARESLARTLADSHCGMPIPEARLEAMIRVQRGRDRRMRAALLESNETDGGVLIAGSGHTRLDWGVGYDLAQEFEPAQVLSVAFLEVRADCRTLADCLERRAGGERPWDVVWFTPRAPRADPCEGLRERGAARTTATQ